ncbi:MAG TPA: hypothetical protein PLJ00_05870 [Chitinophagales bacterium]|nr:hypothetical protein [Chitinophagales bacterium]
MNEVNHIAYKTFDDIVNMVISEKELPSTTYTRLLKLASRGWNVIFREIMPDKISVPLYMTNRTLKLLDFPVDMDDWCKLGVIVVRGGGTKVLVTLSRNEEIYLPNQDDIIAAECTCETSDTTSTLTAVYNGYMPSAYIERYSNFRGGIEVGEMFGVGGGESCAGSFRVDHNNQRFAFSSDVPSDIQIVLEYKPNGSFKGKYTKIHDKAVEALLAFVSWKSLHERNSNVKDRMAAERLFKTEVINLKDTIDPPTMDELLDLLYGSASLTY